MLAKRARPMVGAFGDFGTLTEAFHGGGGRPDSLGLCDGRRCEGDLQLRRGPSPNSRSDANDADQPIDATDDGGICPRGLGAQRRALSVASDFYAARRRQRIRFYDARGDGA